MRAAHQARVRMRPGHATAATPSTVDCLAVYQDDGTVPETEIIALLKWLGMLVRENVGRGNLKGHRV